MNAKVTVRQDPYEQVVAVVFFARQALVGLVLGIIAALFFASRGEGIITTITGSLLVAAAFIRAERAANHNSAKLAAHMYTKGIVCAILSILRHRIIFGS